MTERDHTTTADSVATTNTLPLPSVAITGANGILGQRLIHYLTAGGGAVRPPRRLRAIVRSERAADTLRANFPSLAHDAVVVADYRDQAAMTGAVAGFEAVVHLVGIIKALPGNSYHDAHESTVDTLLRAIRACGTDAPQRVVSISILGATPDATNACLLSKGRADQLLLSASAITAVVLRIPMVLGEGVPPVAADHPTGESLPVGDRAVQALRRQAQGMTLLTGGGQSLEQPIYAGDVIDATCSALCLPLVGSLALDLAGPESVPRRTLIGRAARILGTSPRFIPISGALARGFAKVLEGATANPPVTTAMLGVLEHDDHIDAGRAAARLGITLTSLDETLKRVLMPGQSYQAQQPGPGSQRADPKQTDR